jgi:NitT/TauT family transport system substrate-binding protein
LQKTYRRPDELRIKTLKDLVGKRVGVLALESAHHVALKAAITDAGGDPKAVQFIATGVGVDAMQQLIGGQIDALALPDGAAATIEARFGAISIPSPFLGSLRWTTVEVAKRPWFLAHKDIAVGAARAYAKSIAFALANPEAAVRIHWKRFPASKPADLDEKQAMQLALAELNARLANMAPDQATGLFLYVADADALRYIDAMVTGGILQSRLPLESIWDPSLIKKANEFDRSQIVDAAKAYK